MNQAHVFHNYFLSNESMNEEMTWTIKTKVKYKVKIIVAYNNVGYSKVNAKVTHNTVGKSKLKSPMIMLEIQKLRLKSPIMMIIKLHYLQFSGKCYAKCYSHTPSITESY